MQDAVVAGVEENLRTSLVEQGLNPDVAVRIRDSGHDADPFGGTDVSRVVVGGTVAQSGVDTIGIAQSIDPGNDEGSETAMLLLDRLSAPAGPEDSLNTYLRPRSHRVAFLGQALGNAVSHEVGHLLGSFHTDNDDARSNLMDAGGQGFGRLFGVGPDGVGGTADDTDVDFGVDAYLPAEGLAGQQDTLNTSAWAFLPGAGS